MSRYSQIDSTAGPSPLTNRKDSRPRYVNVKYPEILKDVSDIYVFSRVGDRYDILAQSYYDDSSLWWVISIANNNTTQDSLLIEVGLQIRIPSPSRVNQIISSYKNLNS